MAWTPPFWLRKLDRIREECRHDPAHGLSPEAKLDRIAFLMEAGVNLLREKATWRGVTPDQLLREQAAAAHRWHARRSRRV